MRQKEPCTLKFHMYGFARFAGRADFGDFQQAQRFTLEFTFGSIKKLGVTNGGRPAQKQGVDVHWAIAGGPFQALEPRGDVS